MYRLYGDELAQPAFRLYGAGLGALGASTTSDYIHLAMSPWFNSPDWRSVAAALESAESVLGRQLTWAKPSIFMFSPLGGLKRLRQQAAEADKFLAQLLAEPDPGLGVAALTVGVSAYGAVKGFKAGRKAKQKARAAAYGARAAQEIVRVVTARYCQLLLQLARLGIDPLERPTEGWFEAFGRRLARNGSGNRAVWSSELLAAVDATLKALTALPTPVTAPATLPAPAEPVQTLRPAAAAAAAPETVPAAPGGGAVKLGLALLAARLLLGG